MEKILNYINGKFCEAENGNFINNIEPATGDVYSLIPDSSAQDIEKAYVAAQKAFPAWSNCGIEERCRILTKISNLIDEKLEDLAQAESKDNGKPVMLARSIDIPRASHNFRFFAHAITQFASESHFMENSGINYTLRRPIGVVGCIAPWNLPLYLFSWKIAPALAAGNCVVAKPTEVTPMTSYLLSRICEEAGLPNGVLNIVHGLGNKAGSAIVSHPGIKAISFTGGTATGKNIASIAAPMFKKLSLELGGKNPNIIFADCDFEDALSTSVRSSFANQGQICLCGSRILIERSIYDKFKEAFIKKVNALQVGDPNEKVQIGAVVSSAHMEKVLSYIELAKNEGGTVLAGGHQVKLDGRCSNGYFIAPTVIEGLDHTCRTNTEEIFGPVVTLMPFDDKEDAIEYANSTEYGLSSTVWTQDLNKAHYMAEHLQAGIVWINCWLLRDLRTPFGGMKNSGVGREGGFEALRFFTEAKNVCIRYK
ncbi:MAG: aldehyde dehydrogenase [Chitinophagales bacterium]|nr:aldehyde dehydrogenase [Chitinophagales bacterium]